MKTFILIVIASIFLTSCNQGTANKTYNVNAIGGGKMKLDLIQEYNGKQNVAKVGDTIYCGWSNLKNAPVCGVIESVNN